MSRFSLKPCCVPGCYDNASNRHSIPRNKDCRKIWLTRINNKSSFDLEDKLIASYKVCSSHFENICLINGRLRKFALPTVNLLDYRKTDNDCFFNKTMLIENVTDEVIETSLSTRNATDVHEELSTTIQRSDESEKACCICLKRGMNYNKVSRKTGNKIALLTKLKTCIPEIIWCTYFYICDECAGTLNICYEFRETCLKSDLIRQELKTDKTDEVVNAEFDKNVGETVVDINDDFKEDSPNFGDVDNGSPDEVVLASTDNGMHEDVNDSNFVTTVEEKPEQTRKKRKRVKFFCDKCSVYFSSSANLLHHCTSEHDMDRKDVKPFACDRCPMKFYSSSNLWQHIKYHNGVKSNICSYCGNGFITKTDLVNHEKKHQNKREYKCEQCKKCFNTHKNIRSHKLIVHTDPSVWKYVCSICSKRFPIKSNYNSHMRRHTGEKNFNCHLCDKKFTTKCDLQRHKRSHSYVRDQKCQHCDKEYKDERVLKIHVAKIHGIGTVKIPVKEKRHVCHFCSKAYYDKNKLTRHLYTHSGEKPFNCPVCDKKFNDKSYIKQHLRNTHNVDTNNTLETELNINYMNIST